jgi:hypothetical protein
MPPHHGGRHAASRQIPQQGDIDVKTCAPRELVSIARPIQSSQRTSGEIDMAKGERRGNREVKKPKKEKIKVIAAAPSQKAPTWQSTFAPGKKK